MRSDASPGSTAVGATDDLQVDRLSGARGDEPAVSLRDPPNLF
jgi:hypothetical protein